MAAVPMSHAGTRERVQSLEAHGSQSVAGLDGVITEGRPCDRYIAIDTSRCPYLALEDAAMPDHADTLSSWLLVVVHANDVSSAGIQPPHVTRAEFVSAVVESCG